MAKQRTIREISREIRQDWKNVSPHAEPYLAAMGTLETKEDKYGMDSAQHIVLYFLGNATHYRGETARKVKKELKEIVGIK